MREPRCDETDRRPDAGFERAGDVVAELLCPARPLGEVALPLRRIGAELGDQLADGDPTRHGLPLPPVCQLLVKQLRHPLLTHKLHHEIHDLRRALDHARRSDEMRDGPGEFPFPPLIAPLAARRHRHEFRWGEPGQLPRAKAQHLVGEMLSLGVTDGEG